MLAYSAVATIANEMRKKWASAQKIKLPQISLCRNKAELRCLSPNRVTLRRAQGRNDSRRKTLSADNFPDAVRGHVYS